MLKLERFDLIFHSHQFPLVSAGIGILQVRMYRLASKYHLYWFCLCSWNLFFPLIQNKANELIQFHLLNVEPIKFALLAIIWVLFPNGSLTFILSLLMKLFRAFISDLFNVASSSMMIKKLEVKAIKLSLSVLIFSDM